MGRRQREVVLPRTERGMTAKELERAVGMEATPRKMLLEIILSPTERWDDAFSTGGEGRESRRHSEKQTRRSVRVEKR